MKLYSYARCSTCRKAIAWLGEKGVAVDPIDITSQPPTADELQRALAELGRQRLLNTSGQSYRALGAAAVRDMDDPALLQALAADGKLIKRTRCPVWSLSHAQRKGATKRVADCTAVSAPMAKTLKPRSCNHSDK